MRTLAAFLLLCSCCFGQVKVEVRQMLTGVSGLETIEGKTFVSADSKPVVESVGFVDLGKIPAKPQVLRVRVTDAQRKPVPTERLTDSQYVIRGEGRVWIDARVTDLPSQFLLDEEVEIELPPQKPMPIVPDFQGLPLDARKVVVQFVQNMATDLELLNQDIDAGKVKTVAESAAATTQRDLLTRDKFKFEMRKLIEGRLGKEALPPTAKQTFSDIITGWRSVQ